jgi:hypothetical protein
MNIWIGKVVEEYLKLLESLLNKKLWDWEFCSAFEERSLLIDDIATSLKSNSISLSFLSDEKYNYFSTLMTIIFDICKGYAENAENNDVNSHIEFYFEMKEIYLQIQEILKEDENSLKDSKDFSKLLDQLNWEIKDQYINLMEEFLDGSSDFLEIKKKLESITNIAKTLESNSVFLEINYQALGFSNFIFILVELFDRYQMNPEISLKVLKSWARKILL